GRGDGLGPVHALQRGDPHALVLQPGLAPGGSDAVDAVEVAVARAVHPDLLAAEIDEYVLVHAVVVVRIVRRVVEVALDLAGVGIEDERGVGEQVVTHSHVTVEVRARVADGPEQRVQLLVVGTRDPGRAAAVLPGLAGPGVVAG